MSVTIERVVVVNKNIIGNMFRWLAVSLCGMIIGLEDLAIAQFSITNIEYIAYKNVYYTHAPLQVRGRLSQSQPIR